MLWANKSGLVTKALSMWQGLDTGHSLFPSFLHAAFMDGLCIRAVLGIGNTHSSVLAWGIPGTVEPGGLLSMGSHSRTQLKRLSSSSILSFNIYFSYKNLPSQFARNSIRHKVSNSWRSLPSTVGLEVMGKIRGRLYCIKKSNEHINSGPLKGC